MSKNFKLNLKGLNELMKSQEMLSILDSAANSVAAAAGDGFEVEQAHPISFVGITSVRASDFKARLACSRNNVLEKAVRSVKI